MRSSIWALAVLGMMLLLACAGIPAPGEFLLLLLFGWAHYALRVVPSVHFNPSNIAFGLLALAALGVGVHFMVSWFYREAGAGDPTRQPWHRGWSLAIVAVVLLAFVGGISMVGITHQFVWLISDDQTIVTVGMVSVRRAALGNNFRQVGVNVRRYVELHDAYPPGASQNEHGRLLHGWQALLLPYADTKVLVDKIDYSLPWNDESNRPAFQTPHPLYSAGWDLYGKHPEGEFAPSIYAANVRLIGGVTPQPSDIPDGASNTIFAGEVAGPLPAWGHPTNWRDPALGFTDVARGFGSPWENGVHVQMADGSVQFLSRDTDPRVLAALATPADGDSVASDSRLAPDEAQSHR